MDTFLDFWSLAASITTSFGFIIIAISALIALRSFQEMKNTRYLEAMLRIYDIIGSKEAKQARGYVYNKLPENPDEVTEKDIEIINEISTQFDRIGTLVKYGLVPKGYLLDSHHAIFMKMWDKLEKHIQQRRFDHQVPYHVKNFEWFAKICKEYDKKHYSKNVSK